MKIWFITSECAPFSKSGGLADVAFSLPPALKQLGHEIGIITPLYRCVRENYAQDLKKLRDFSVDLGDYTFTCGLWEGDRAGVPVWFIGRDEEFDRPRLYGYDDDKWRFALFCKACVQLLDEDMPFRPDIMHCNDWESALAVIYLRDEQFWRVDLQHIKAVFTIHNIAYQGQFGKSELHDCFHLDEGWYGGGLAYEYQGRHDINLMKGAMLMSNAVSTVSPTYARELHSAKYGAGLQGVVDMVGTKMRGILNGIDMDLYDPMKDDRIPAPFSKDDMSGKAVCKAYIQKAFGLNVRPGRPLLASVARLVEQKGIEIIRAALPRLMEMGVQLIVYGQGDQMYIDYFKEAMERWPGQIGFSSDYNEPMAARVFAGADYYLMPSRFEPCGLSQMMAMRYGTIPIVHETGGLKDSVRSYSDFDGLGDGFSFVDYTGQALYLAVLAAVRMYFADQKMFLKLRERCMRKDFSWTRSAEEYCRMYEEIADLTETDGTPVTFFQAYDELSDLIARSAAQHAGEIGRLHDRTIQVHITGRGDGFFNILLRDGKMFTVPNMDAPPDAILSASLDNLKGIMNGTISPHKLFLHGQLKITGNLAKGAEIYSLLMPKND
ncbi:MAG: hypothetical protein CW338_00885 [Clostridiales bacterium]|nr:hypothetical protein [Clostridiales bacterium]